MIQQINYDLKKPGQNYDGLINTIKSLGSWAKPCESCFLIKTSLSANSIYELLRPCIDANDRLLINRFHEKDRQGWLTSEIWDWIRSNTENQQHV